MKVSFKCPSCGNETFTIESKAKSYDQLIGAPCSRCGRSLTRHDVEAQAKKIAVDLFKKAMKKGRL